MAREVVTHIWCDVCLNEDDEKYTAAKEMPPITIGQLKPRVLALCEVHEKEVYDPIRDIVAELGVIADLGHTPGTRMPGTSPGSGIHPCPVPTCHKHDKPFKHEQSLRNHSKQVHGVAINELRARYEGNAGGNAAPAEDDLFTPREPLSAPAPVAAVEDATCEHCGKSYPAAEYSRPAQALGVHLAKEHGIRGKKHDRKGDRRA